jgi:hypothetical protein
MVVKWKTDDGFEQKISFYYVSCIYIYNYIVLVKLKGLVMWENVLACFGHCSWRDWSDQPKPPQYASNSIMARSTITEITNKMVRVHLH